MTPLLLVLGAAVLAAVAAPSRRARRPPAAWDGSGQAGRAMPPHARPHAGLRLPLARPPLPRRAARRRQLEEAVPEVLDVLRATIAAGTAPRWALQAAAEAAPEPLAALLGGAVRVAELGAGAGQALAAAARAGRSSELLLAGEALDLAETTGAPPGPILAGVAAAAADRVRARQARLAGMAPAFLAVLAVTSPSDAAFLVRERFGWATLAAAVVLEAAGVCWAGRIVGGAAS